MSKYYHRSSQINHLAHSTCIAHKCDIGVNIAHCFSVS
ncbi:hypothetical protein CU280_04150 [Yersinia mollaretii]|nr:hypothetical protein CU280_04150 [Yersinia mollaretii]